eukprot:8900956-Karenia_brevis.AAC.1
MDDDTPGASGSAHGPDDGPEYGTYQQIQQMELEAYYQEPEPTNEIIGPHDTRSVVSTNAPSGGRMSPRSVGS